ncbi:MAG TPA: sigma-70 family RNA polymerase sigma factor [Jatrophihabitans sp.]|nr:sigma-70 family RNA polymerase sigma factor [Jatrophihabitans sp.]
MDSDEIADQVRRARDGDAQAWETIVGEFTNLVWATVRGFRLSDAQAADAVQATWLRLVEHVDAVREPARIAGWLSTTCQRVCLEIVRGAGRETPVDPQDEARMASVADPSVAHEPEWAAVHREDMRLVQEALAHLDERDRTLLRLLASSQRPSYQQIAARLGMPIGSIGPTRARALNRLRAALAELGLVDLAP